MCKEDMKKESQQATCQNCGRLKVFHTIQQALNCKQGLTMKA